MFRHMDSILGVRRPGALPLHPEAKQVVLARERHLLGNLAGAKPRELLDVVCRDGVALGLDDPREAEHEMIVVRVDVGADPFDRPDVEPRLLEELAPEAVERQLALLEEAARQVPVTLAGLDLAAADQDSTVTDAQPL